MTLYEKIVNKEEKISVVGLGYVGMPIAITYAKKTHVIGFDIDNDKIKQYKLGIDPTNEVGNEEIKSTSVEFTSDETRLKEAKFHIITVPTPINSDKTPNLSSVESASRTVGRNLVKGSIVVYESTVYPGVTEDICIPIIEEESGLKCGVDFKVGYSPERINPGDKIHRLSNIVKIVSGIDNDTLEEIAKVYELIIDAGVHRAPSIKVAEAAKVAENSQRDINIAFMNELAMVFDRMEIDTKEVIEAMNTKWNALKFYPGLVSGHCIGIDPYYFVYQAAKLGYHSQIIISGRKINDEMGKYVANKTIKKLVLANKVVRNARVVIFGITFKPNVSDTRNSRVVDIFNRLKEYGIEAIVVDPLANKDIAKKEYGIDLLDLKDVKDADCLVFAVAHDAFKKMSWEEIDSYYGEFDNSEKVLIDVHSIFNQNIVKEKGYSYWRL